MSAAFLVVDGYTVTIQPQSAAVPGAVQNMVAAVTPAPRLKASGKSVLCTAIAYTVPATSGCALPGGTFGGGAAKITATAQKNKADGLQPMREGDEGVCAGGFQVGTTATACSCKFKIVAAGQQKARGE